MYSPSSAQICTANLSSTIGYGLILVSIILFFGATCSLAAPLTLNDCYQIALKERETLKQRAADIQAAQARYQQSLAELYPQLGIGANQRMRDNPDFGSLTRGSFNDPQTGLPRTSRTLGRTQFEGLVTLTQPIFRGFREFALTRASDAERESLAHQYERDKQLLYTDVASLYYQILLYQDQEKAIASGEKTRQDRLKELGQFAELGKSRQSEIHAAQADLAQQSLLKQRTRRSRDTLREVLASLLRLSSSNMELAAAAQPRAVPSLNMLLTNIKNREDVQAARLNRQMSEELITAEERAWWPSINFDMNGYVVDDPNRHRDWDMVVRMSMPVFDGGRIAGRVAEKQAQLLRSQSELAERSRLAEQEVREAYVSMERSREAIEQAKELYKARQKSVQSQQEDYRNGQVTNLDVMNALSLLQVSELDLIETKYAYANDVARVTVSAGEAVK